MLHKHPSAEKAQVYFGITEKLKHDAANFFIYIQPKLAQIYDNSAYRALGEHFNFQEVRDKHLTHLSTLLTGGIDHRFIEESHLLHKKYIERGVTMGEYIKLYQLIISYLSGEAHKKHWLRYKKYRDLNRSIRNLLLFDLAIATSSKELELSLSNAPPYKMLLQSALSIEDPTILQTTLEELKELLEASHAIINECHLVIQSILTSNPLDKSLPSQDSIGKTLNIQTSLFSNEFEEYLDIVKAPSNQNQPTFEEILSLTQGKIQKVSKAISMKTEKMDSKEVKALEEILNDIHEDIRTITHTHLGQTPTIRSSQRTLHTLLKKSSAEIGSHLTSLEQLKERTPL